MKSGYRLLPTPPALTTDAVRVRGNCLSLKAMPASLSDVADPRKTATEVDLFTTLHKPAAEV